MWTKLNIGLNIADQENALTVDKVATAVISLFDPMIVHVEVRQSKTEATAIVTLLSDVRPSKGLITLLCVLLQQDAIAGRVDGEQGFLYGPKAAAWGEFDPAYFLE